MVTLRGLFLALCLIGIAAPVRAQAVPVRRLVLVKDRFERGFTELIGVHELRDGRLIVVDRLERSVLVLDANWSGARAVGRTGSGPGEYLLPSRIIAFSGDSSAVMDAPNGRFLVLTPDATVARVMDLEGRPAGGAPSRGSVSALRAVDQNGDRYGEASPISRSSGRAPEVSDSAAIERWGSDGEPRDTIAFIPVSGAGDRRITGGFVVRTQGERTAFKAKPQWAVARDGWVAIVYEDPYRVDMIDPNGVRRSGRQIRYEAVKVTDGHKRMWCEERERPSPWLSVTRGGGPPTLSMRRNPCNPPTRWPDHLPPFLSEAATFASDGRLWVKRTVPAGEPTVFDVIDRSGRVVEQVMLPVGRRLVGFGARDVYLVFRDGVDLEYLERYPVRPSPGSE